ncbi:hypothetical protein PMZ80_009425 [Knufia obscura]|uniref:AA9 family lytic polysaccharide monooxygenase n=1 Tax=Knufia obscura TaxID=1635080 RepID=A0ABR0REB8_9EURO|nr:hypothetical protein PMZ80_009425 [Knufia obscura]
MKSFTIAALAALLPAIEAHTRFTTLAINGQSQGDGTCIRMDPNPSTTTGFISGLSSPDMACGVGGATAVNRTCSASPGDSLSLLHRSWADGAQPGSIDPSHKGTTAVYMKKMGGVDSTDPYGNEATGDGWAKIMYDGFSDGSWGTEKMISANGIVGTNIPSDIAPGYYLVRSEILAMQNVEDGENPTIHPQFYVGCAQVFIGGSGSGELTNADTATIPGYVDESTPFNSYNIYKSFPPAQPFEEFGPKVYGSDDNANVNVNAKVAATSTDSTSTTTTPSIVGACPPSTILEVSNMCLTEIPSWSNDAPGYLTKCWAASQTCWDTLDKCWDNVNPAVNARDKNAGCNLWDAKCQGIVSWCEGGNLEGPPGSGEVLTPKKGSLGRRDVQGRRSLVARALTAKMVGGA